MEIVGLVGAICILVGFVGHELFAWRRASWRYDLVNTVGAALLLMYALDTNSLPFILLNIVWLVVALKDIVTRLVRN